MHADRCTHGGWLHIGEGNNLHCEGRFGRIVNSFPRPSEQFPSLIVYLGRRAKDSALKTLYQHNNLKRYKQPRDAISLHVDNTSIEQENPCLFVIGDPNVSSSESSHLRGGVVQQPCHFTKTFALPWADTTSPRTQDMILSQVVFVHTDVICIFAEDVGGLDGIKTLLDTWAHFGIASTLPSPVRPRVIIVCSDETYSATFSYLERGFSLSDT